MTTAASTAAATMATTSVQATTLVLAIDATFDDTSVAVVEVGRATNGSMCATTLAAASESSWAEHADKPDVDKELAAVRHQERLPDVCRAVLARANTAAEQVDAVAFSSAPGSMACLQASFEFARTLSLAAGRPLLSVNHVEAHFLVADMEGGSPLTFPALVLQISGGNCQLFVARALGDYYLLGQTRDGAPGQVLDKVARRLGLDTNIPGCGGAAVEKLAATARDPSRFVAALRVAREPGCGFAFAGVSALALKLADDIATADQVDGTAAANLCAALQETIADQIVDRTLTALAFCDAYLNGAKDDQQTEPMMYCAIGCVVLSGGVAANMLVRRRMQQALVKRSAGFGLLCPPPRLCTDNAEMVAYTAGRYLLDAPDRCRAAPLSVCLEHERALGKDICARVVKHTQRNEQNSATTATPAAVSSNDTNPFGNVGGSVRLVTGDDYGLGLAAAQLRAGQLVAFPTETVYGLGADAFNEAAIRRIYVAKSRPSDNPLIVHVADYDQFDAIAGAQPPPTAAMVRVLRDKFMPGPFSVVVANAGCRVASTVARDTVVLRMPDNPVAIELIRRAGPISAPSANVSGRPSPTTAEHVLHDFEGRGVWGVINGGAAREGVESTVLDCTCFPPVILREGPVTKKQIWTALGLAREDADDADDLRARIAAPKSPGMKYRHYAPSQPFVVVDGSLDALNRHIASLRSQGRKVGVIACEGEAVSSAASKVWYCLAQQTATHPDSRDSKSTSTNGGHSQQARSRSLAYNFYAALRGLDRPAEVDIILMRAAPVDTDMGPALMERALKAADGNVLALRG